MSLPEQSPYLQSLFLLAPHSFPALHDPSSMIKCCRCTRGFKHFNALYDHQRAKDHWYCPHCKMSFHSEQALEQHNGSLHVFLCGTCSKTFPRCESLQWHQRNSKHCWCPHCDISFANEHGLQEHRSALHENVCTSCNRIFSLIQGLQNHQRAKSHLYCKECDRFFTNSQALQDHLQFTIHTSQYHCCNCDRDFKTEQALEQHLRDKYHPEKSLECEACNRTFIDEDALSKHLASVIHKPLSDLKCIASSKCKATFASPSALIHHLESGKCRSGHSRQGLNQLIQQHDQERIISREPEMSELLLLRSLTIDDVLPPSPSPGILTPSTGSSDAGGCLLTPDASSEGSFNWALAPTSKSKYFRCPLCPPHRKGFATKWALESHLESPAHAPKIFHCPVNLLPTNGKRNIVEMLRGFSTLSGLTQHVESGACQGGKRTLRAAMGLVELQLREMGFQNVSLLK